MSTLHHRAFFKLRVLRPTSLGLFPLMRSVRAVAVLAVISPLELALAEGVGMVGPSAGELSAYVFVPMLCLLALSIPMLFSLRSFVALLSGLLLGAVWLGMSVLFLGSGVTGAYLLAYSGWATVFLVAVCYYVAERKGTDIYKVSSPRNIGKTEARRLREVGQCPTCDAVIPMSTLECPNCQASFGRGSPVKIKRI